jgi:SAM-dependent methyltransferase
MSKEIKDMVRSKYNQIALQSKKHAGSSCCGSTPCCDDKMDYTIMSDEYSHLEGYHEGADLKLGCGIPTEYAAISEGNTVIDLGSGAGNDAFVVRSIVGDHGNVIGIDFAGAMLTKARENAKKLGFGNVSFLKGDIEEIPVVEETADVVISNCVLNLVPDKAKAFSEMYRVIKKGGHFCVSDIVLVGKLPGELIKEAEMYAGCIASAIQKDDYLNFIREAGFTNVEIKKTKDIILPDELLARYLSAEALEDFRNSNTGIFSITVVGYKE